MKLVAAAVQPPVVEIRIVDGVFVKQMLLRNAGMVVPQHSHNYEHLSMLATGSVRIWAGDDLLGEFQAPTGIVIKPRIKHTFLSLEDNTVVYCIHNISRADAVEIDAEHQFTELS